MNFHRCPWLALVLALGGPAWGEQAQPPQGVRDIQVKLQFDPGALKTVFYGEFTGVELDGCLMPEDEPGTPWLPARFVNVLVPPGAVVQQVSVRIVREAQVGVGVKPYPVQPPVPRGAPAPAFVGPKAEAYQGQGRRQPMQSFNAQHMRGNTFVPVRVNPVRYTPADGALHLALEIDLTVSVIPAAPAAARFDRHAQLFVETVKTLVVNPNDPVVAELTPVPAVAPADEPLGACDYLIITKDALKTTFQALADHRAARNGYTTQVVTTEWINTTYTGKDLQDKIRNCIKDFVATKSTLFVVLGGDSAVVPDRDCYVSCGSYVENNMPTDLYYAGLDGTWDENNNGVYGEAGTDSVDLAYDVLVGRIPIQTAQQATDYINKVKAYDTNPAPVEGKFIFGGKACWNTYTGNDRPTDTLNDGHMQFRDANHPSVSDSEIWTRRAFRDCVQNNGWMASRIGILADTLTSWDTSTGGDYAAGGQHMIDRLSEGWNLLVIDTHGNTDIWAMEGDFVSSSAASLTGPTNFVYTMACITGAFDNGEPCLSEAFLRNPNGGALAYLGCSRYGWGSPGSTNGGTSSEYMRKWLEYIFKDGNINVGKAYHLHKSYFASFSSSNGSYRWVQFGLNLQGDPALDINGVKPRVSIAATTPLCTEPGTATFTVTSDKTVSSDLTVLYTVGGTASPGSDYVAPSGSVTIAGGASTATISVTILDDNLSEGDETMVLTLAAGTGYTVGSPSAATATIQANDPIVTITATDATAGEPATGFEGGQFMVTRAGATAPEIVVNFTVGGTAAAGSDYAALSGSVTIPSGATSATIPVNVLDDNLVEESKTVTVTLVAGSNYLIGSPSSAEVTLHDDDATVTITATDANAGEPASGHGTGTFTVSRAGFTGAALTVYYTVGGMAVGGSDYTALSGSVSIPAGATTATILVEALDDNVVEGNKTLTVSLTTGAGYTIGNPSSAEMTLFDDDAPPPADHRHKKCGSIGLDLMLPLAIGWWIRRRKRSGRDVNPV